MSVCSTEESDGEEPIGSKLSFMELLAAVGQSAPHPNRRLEFSPFHPDTSSTELDVEGESALADSDKGNLSPVSQHVYDQHFDGGDQWRERDHTFIDSPLGGHLESDDLIAELPEDGGVLYDYDYPISDTERRKSPPPEVQTVPLDAEGAPPSWKKRKRHGKGDVLPNCRKSTGMGAVEIAMRRSATRTTTHIFEPVVGMKFDSVGEAHSFFNLYSWEKGFGIRYGKSYTNRGNKYRSMQEIECGNAGFDNRVKHSSKRCDCKVMIRLHRTDDHGWYISRYDADHNHDLSTSCGEKMQWPSHRHIDEHTRDMIKCLRENNISLTKVHGVLGSFFGSVQDLPFTKRSLRTVCSQISREQLDDDVKKTLEHFRKIRDEDPDFAFFC